MNRSIDLRSGLLHANEKNSETERCQGKKVVTRPLGCSNGRVTKSTDQPIRGRLGPQQ